MSKYSDTIPPDIQGAVGWMLEYIKPGTSFLDVGCSTGYFGGFIKSYKGIAVDGVEISEDIIEARKHLDEVRSFDVDKPWPKLAKRYDYIYFGDVLEHLTSPSDALAEAAKFLKKDGLIFVSIPNIAHISIRLELLRGSFQYEPTGILDNTHLQYFTRNGLLDAAHKAGLAAELVDYTDNDIPKEIIQKYLKQAGLSAGPKFWELTRQLESRASQLKFIVKPGNPVKVLTHKLDKPLQYREDILKSFQSQLDTIHEHADKQAAIIKHYTDKCEELEDQNRILRRQLAEARSVKGLAKGVKHKLQRRKPS